MSKNSLIIGLVVVLLIIAVAAGAWFYFSGGEMPGQEGSGEESPDVVARVNGQDITRSKLETAEEQVATEQGFEISSLDAEMRNQLQEQALDTLVSYTLLQQRAEQLGVVATEEEIAVQVNSIKAQFENDAEYEAMLNQEGISESELRSQIAEGLTIQAYIEEALDLAQVTATEEEVMSEYEKAATTDEGFPELSEVRGQIESFIVQQKQQQIISQHIQALQTEGDIEILIYSNSANVVNNNSEEKNIADENSDEKTTSSESATDNSDNDRVVVITMTHCPECREGLKPYLDKAKELGANIKEYQVSSPFDPKVNQIFSENGLGRTRGGMPIVCINDNCFTTMRSVEAELNKFIEQKI